MSLKRKRIDLAVSRPQKMHPPIIARLPPLLPKPATKRREKTTHLRNFLLKRAHTGNQAGWAQPDDWVNDTAKRMGNSSCMRLGVSSGMRLGVSSGMRLGVSSGMRLGNSSGLRLGNSSSMRLGNSSGMRLGVSSCMRLGVSSCMRLGVSSGMRLGNSSCMRLGNSSGMTVFKIRFIVFNAAFDSRVHHGSVTSGLSS